MILNVKVVAQGKMETYKQQVDDLNKRLSELQVENESLENRNRLLEKVVQIKDQKPPAVAEAAPLVCHHKRPDYVITQSARSKK